MNAGVVRRIAEIAADRPDLLAVRAPDAALTYSALLGRALDVAAGLRAAGVRNGDLTALCLPRSAGLVVGALGILAAGAAYVALDPDQPDSRLRYMLEDSGARVLVGPPDLAERLGVELSVTPSERETSSTGIADAAPDDAAYVVYTSGSTGHPKGVVVEHAGLLNLIDWQHRAFKDSAADRCSMLVNPGFDAAVCELWPALTAGASLHVPADELKTDPIRLRDWLIGEEITISFMPTLLAETMIALQWPDSAALRFLHTGGDVLRRHPPVGLPFELVNNYGLTETSVTSTACIVPPIQPGDTELPSIGRAIDGVELRVVDAAGAPVPTGVIGELLVCGVSVARGYLNLPELTAQRFVTDPLDPTSRAFRTGDLVRIGGDGVVEFAGRADDQVQIRGYRVELSEIACALDQFPGVQASSVTTGGDADDSRLLGFVTGNNGAPVDILELRSFLSQRLPEYMVPPTILQVDEIPTTPNGKVDRNALLATAQRARIADRTSLSKPRNDLEATLAALVAERLKLPEVGIDENFFLLGGHSMLGAQLVARIADVYDLEVPLLALFDNPTVAQMAVEVERLIIEEIALMSDESLEAAAGDLED